MAEANKNIQGTINNLNIYHVDAYAVAVRNGYKGTEAEWLASLAESANGIAMDYAEQASRSANNAKASEAEAKAAAESAKASVTSAQNNASVTNAYAANAMASALGANTSATNAKASETNAKASETNAVTAAASASASETNAKASEENAKRYADEVRSVAEATPAYLDYLAHYNYRVQQITANEGTKFQEFHENVTIPEGLEGKRGIAMLPISGFDSTAWEGGEYTEYPIAIMHPKTNGVQDLYTTGSVRHLLVAKGVTEITSINSNINTVDLTLFTGDMPFPTLGYGNTKVLVQKGRKAELQSMTNWSGCNIEEVETW